MSLDQVANPLPHDPVVAGNRVASLLEIMQELGARATDVVPLIRNDVVLEVWMPLAKSPDDEAAIRRPHVESRQHLPAPSLEPRLKVVRAVGDLARIDERLSALEQRLPELALRERAVRQRDDRNQRDRDCAARDAYPVAWTTKIRPGQGLGC